MGKRTTISIDEGTLERLWEQKEDPRETHDDTITRALDELDSDNDDVNEVVG